jgi:branched-subunit amino acid aminotransferase/4-amino-4-deoxychorismate lyase
VTRPDPAAGVFETVRVEDGRALWLERHLARLRAGAQALYGEAPELEACVADALRTAPGEPCRLRIAVVPGHEPEATLAPLGPAASTAPVPLRPWTLPGGLGAHKWVDRRLVDQASARLGATPLIVEPGGEVLEAAYANIWVLEGRRLITPPADGRLLPGVTRARLLELAPQLDLQITQASLSLNRLASADAVFLTSALRMAIPGMLENGAQSENDAVVRSIATALHSESVR